MTEEDALEQVQTRYVRTDRDRRTLGQLVLDGTGGWTSGAMHMDEQQRAANDAADADYRLRHADWHAVRWSMEGSSTFLCGHCCTSLPLSEAQSAAVSRIFERVTPETELDTWLQILTCGHETASNVNVCYCDSQKASGVVRCPVCDVHRGVVTVEWLGTAVSADAAGRRAERVKVDEELRAAQADVAK